MGTVKETTREFCPVCYGRKYADLQLYDASGQAAFRCLRCSTVHFQRVWEDFEKEGFVQYDMKKFWKIINRLKARTGGIIGTLRPVTIYRKVLASYATIGCENTMEITKMITRAKTHLALREIKPELVNQLGDALQDVRMTLAKDGTASSGALSEGHWRYKAMKGGATGKTWKQDYLYEDHPHERNIRFEFRYEWAHEPHNSMGARVGEVLRDILTNKIDNVASVATMFGHYGESVSSVLVLVWLKRPLLRRLKLWWWNLTK